MIFIGILSRILSSESMAVFFLAQSIAVFLSLFGRFGLDNTLLRYVAEFNAKEEIANTVIVVRKGVQIVICISLIMATGYYLLCSKWIATFFLKTKLLNEVSVLIALWSIFLSIQFVQAGIFRGFKEIKNAVIFGGAITSILSPVALSILLLFNTNINLTLSITVLIMSGYFSFILGFILLKRKLKSYKIGSTGYVTYRKIVSHSWPLLIYSISFYMLTQSGIWIVGLHYAGIDLASFGAANRLVLLTSMTLVIVNSVLPPLIAQYNLLNEKTKLQELLRSTATLAATPVLGILAGFIIFPEPILRIVFGQNYSVSAPVLVVFTLSQVVSVLVGSCGYVLIMTGHKNIMMIISIVSSFIAVLTAFMVVKRYGPFGVACAYSLAVVLQQILMLLAAKVKVGVWTCVGSEGVKLLLKGGLFHKNG